MSLPLKGVTVLEFSQYLAGPYAGLRLADLGARVIKIERPGTGDACRKLVTKNKVVDGDSVLFHTINRNKESFTLNLKNEEDLATVKQLVAKADVLTHNFRPGIMSRLGLDYDNVKQLNPGIVYGEVSGYGEVGPWRDKPGQDLLAQALSGLCWLTGNANHPPTPFGLAVADMLCGTHLAQGLLAALVNKKRKGRGMKVEVSLLESLIDFQFEGLTAFLNSEQLPKRSALANAHAYIEAPYGIYPTADGHIAISMGDLKILGDIIACDAVRHYQDDGNDAFEHRDAIKQCLTAHFERYETQHWLRLLEAKDYWCSPVFNYQQLTQQEAYQVLQIEQTVSRSESIRLKTTRCPIRYNDEKLFSDKAAPVLGSANTYLREEFGL